MRLLIAIVTFGVLFASSSQPVAADNSGATTVSKKAASAHHRKKARKKLAATTKAKEKSDLQTDVKFDDSVLHGQYQTPEEALAKVENEKGLTDLLGVRKHFKDRLATAAEQE